MAKSSDKNEFLGTGRRKTSVARVRVKQGSGQFLVNGRPVDEFFCSVEDQYKAKAPLVKTEQASAVDVRVKVTGGGTTGQAGAVMLGLARALKSFNPDLEPALREAHLLTRDGRMKERKKYGRKGARKSFQFSKR